MPAFPTEEAAMALEFYGYPRDMREERREALLVTFTEGPHESQVQMRRDVIGRVAGRLCWCWLAVALRLLKARLLVARLLVLSRPSGGETRRYECASCSRPRTCSARRVVSVERSFHGKERQGQQKIRLPRQGHGLFEVS